MTIATYIRDVFARQVAFCASVSECTPATLEFCLEVEKACARIFSADVHAYKTQMLLFCDLLKASRHFHPCPHADAYPPHAFAVMTLLELVHVFLPPSHILHQRISYANTLLGDENGQTDAMERATLPPFMAEDKQQAQENSVVASDMAIHATLREKTYLDEPCPNCGRSMLIAIMQQTRSGDEGQTLGKRCTNATCDWSEINID